MIRTYITLKKQERHKFFIRKRFNANVFQIEIFVAFIIMLIIIRYSNIHYAINYIDKTLYLKINVKRIFFYNCIPLVLRKVEKFKKKNFTCYAYFTLKITLI